jgi:hypothetical protein
MSALSLSERVIRAIGKVRTAFGAPGDWGYDTPKGKALLDLYQLGFSIGHRPDPTPDEPLQDRLASCLAACIDTPLLTVRDVGSNASVWLTLGSFDAALGEMAASLLEEAGAPTTQITPSSAMCWTCWSR